MSRDKHAKMNNLRLQRLDLSLSCTIEKRVSIAKLLVMEIESQLSNRKALNSKVGDLQLWTRARHIAATTGLARKA